VGERGSLPEQRDEALNGSNAHAYPEHFTASWIRPAINTLPRSLKRSEVVARQIVEDVLRRRLSPGGLLAPESVMLAQYGVGRATLREALRLLEAQGLVVLRPGPGGGTVLSSVDASDLGGTATLFFRLAGATYRDLVQAITLIQPWLAEMAATRPDHKVAAAELFEAIDVTDAVRDEPQGVFRTGPAFHAVMATLSDNPVLSTFTNSLEAIFTNQVLSTIDLTPRQAEFLDAHRGIAKAISAGRRGEARRLAHAHAEDLLEYCEERATQRLDQVVEWL
jgi:GntR family transcriptional regulator, transcriptional repressor for pyruvate dehydrogenase complex